MNIDVHIRKIVMHMIKIVNYFKFCFMNIENFYSTIVLLDVHLKPLKYII